jgi:hypothetical protein
MDVRGLVFSVAPALLLCLIAPPALAEHVYEAWRGAIEDPSCVSINPTDGSCRFTDRGRLQTPAALRNARGVGGGLEAEARRQYMAPGHHL